MAHHHIKSQYIALFLEKNQKTFIIRLPTNQKETGQTKGDANPSNTGCTSIPESDMERQILLSHLY